MCVSRQQAEHGGAGALLIGQPVEQIEHAAAFGMNRLAGPMMATNRLGHGLVGLKLGQVQLRVAARQIEAIDFRQLAVAQGREEPELGPQFAQQIEIGLIEKGKGGVPRHTDTDALEQRLDDREFGRGKADRRRQAGIGAGSQGIGGGIQARIQISQLGSLYQAQVAAGQLDLGAARQGAIPANGWRQRITQDLAMAHAAHPVAQHPGERQVGLKSRQAMGQGAKGLGHARAIHHRQHRHTKAARQIRRRGRAVEQAHHPFDQNQIGLPRCLPEALAAFGFAHHPQIQLVHQCAAGAGEDHRVEKVRPALEYPHPLAGAAMQARQGGGHRGLALAGGRRGDQ